MKKGKFLIIEKWNEEDIMPNGRCHSHISAYGFRNTIDIKEIKGYAEKYSPYDYVDAVEYDNEEKYCKHIERSCNNGGSVKYYFY